MQIPPDLGVIMGVGKPEFREEKAQTTKQRSGVSMVIPVRTTDYSTAEIRISLNIASQLSNAIVQALDELSRSAR